MDHGITIFTEGELDDMVENDKSLPQLPQQLISGCNIKTGCYGLFSVCLDSVKKKKDKTLLNNAIKALDTIRESVAFNGMVMYYPPKDLSNETILKLAQVIILLNDAGNNMEAENVPDSIGTAFLDQAFNIIGFRDDVVEIPDMTPEEEDEEARQEMIAEMVAGGRESLELLQDMIDEALKQLDNNLSSTIEDELIKKLEQLGFENVEIIDDPDNSTNYS